MQAVRHFIQRHRVVLGMLLIVQCIAIFLLMTESGHRRDEKVHSRIIKKVFAQQLQTRADLENLTNIPGYHIALGTIARGALWFNDEFRLKHRYNRYLSATIFGSLFVIVLSGVVHLLAHRREVFIVLASMPVIFLFTFLVYTDIPALAFFLLGYGLLLRKRHGYAAIAFLLSLLIRQDMILYIAAVVAIDGIRATYGTRLRMPIWRDVRRVVKYVLSVRYIPYYLLAGAFIAFVVINGGVAVSDRHAHPSGSLHWGNIYFALIVFVVTMLPIVGYHLLRLVRTMSCSWTRCILIVGALCGGYVFYSHTFVIDHAYNWVVNDRFLHNDILIAIATHQWAKIISYGVIVVGIAALIGARWRRPVDALVFLPFALLALSLHWLIEPRYAIVPIVLYLLWMRIPRRVLWMQIAYALALCMLTYTVFIAKDDYFL